jgi:hypothetical protein
MCGQLSAGCTKLPPIKGEINPDSPTVMATMAKPGKKEDET